MTDDSMELAAFVALRIALGVLSLAGTILAEILCGFGCGVYEEFHFDPAKRFP